MSHETTITEYIMQEQRRFPLATGDFTALLNYVRLACKRISFLVGRGGLRSAPGPFPEQSGPGGGAEQDGPGGGAPRPGVTAPAPQLADVANEIFLRTNEYGGHLAAMYSGRRAAPYLVPDCYPRGRYLLVFDPLDGDAGLSVNVAVGSMFSVLRCPEGAEPSDPAAFLQAGRRQLCAGYALYGPATMLVLTVGRGVHGFTLDRGFGEFILTHPDLRIPDGTREIAVNASSERLWDPPVKRYVTECMAGHGGPRGADYTTRWIASPVAELHRLLLRGGMLLYPRDVEAPEEPGFLRLLGQADAMALLVEQAGGVASTGRARILDVTPQALSQRVPVYLGTGAEVERIERYHQEHDAGLDVPFESPLFRDRSLFNG